jgi:hypothetical protein
VQPFVFVRYRRHGCDVCFGESVKRHFNDPEQTLEPAGRPVT